MVAEEEAFGVLRSFFFGLALAAVWGAPPGVCISIWPYWGCCWGALGAWLFCGSGLFWGPGPSWPIWEIWPGSNRLGAIGGGIIFGGLFSELWMLHSRHHHSYKYASLKAASLLKWILASSTSMDASWLHPSWSKYWWSMAKKDSWGSSLALEKLNESIGTDGSGGGWEKNGTMPVLEKGRV